MSMQQLIGLACVQIVGYISAIINSANVTDLVKLYKFNRIRREIVRKYDLSTTWEANQGIL